MEFWENMGPIHISGRNPGQLVPLVNLYNTLHLQQLVLPVVRHSAKLTYIAPTSTTSY